MTKRMSIIPSAAVVDHRLSRTDLAVLCALGTYTNRHGECWPATTTLAKDINVETRAIRRGLRNLENCGYVETTHRQGHRSTYQIVGIVGVDPGHKRPPPRTPETGDPGHPCPPNDNTERINGAFSAQAEFDAFWQLYPPRRPHSNPKKPARAKFDAAVKNGTAPADIIRGARNYAAYVRQEGTNPKYVAQAQTWLGQERWTEYQTAMPSSEAAGDSDVIH